MSEASCSSTDPTQEIELLRARIRELERGKPEQYERSLALLHAALESTADGLLVLDNDGQIVFFNQQFVDMWRLPPEVVATRDDKKFRNHSATQVKNPDEWRRRIEELHHHPDEECLDEIHFLDGRIFERYSKPQRVGGMAVGRVWSFRDVTEQRRSEQRLRESEARYRHLVSQAPISIWEVDFTEAGRRMEELRREGVTDLREHLAARPEVCEQLLRLLRVLDMNEASLALFDASSKEELFDALPRLFTSETYREFGLMLGAFWEGQTQVAGETPAVTLKGRPIHLLVHWAFPVQDGRPGLSRVIVVVDDVTQRVRLKDELLKAQKLESIGRLAGGIAHDFNNLLAVIVGQASMQLRSGSLPVRARESLRDILHAAERGSALTQQLLAYARGGLQKPVPVDLNAVVESVMKILRRIMSPQVEFSLELLPGLPRIMADPSQIEQVIMNLCLNAGQASPVPGRVEVTTETATMDESRAEQLGLAAGEYVRFRIRDFGRGMDPVTLEHIFEPFYTTKPDGRGMGLAVTLGIVQSHRGHIEVASARDRGTTMTVWLPALEASRGGESAPAKPRPRTAPLPRGSETVLVIDDDAAVNKTVETVLSSLGYCVVGHVEPEVALTFMESNAEDIHLILLDANLPRFTVGEMFEHARRLCPQAPVLLASGYDLHEQCRPLLKRGAAGFIQKPFSLVTLATAVREALDAGQREGKLGE